MNAKSLALSPWVHFWGPALLLTPTNWVVGTVSLMVLPGESFSRSAVLASFGAIGGLLLWLTYRMASRRRDGLSAFIVGMIVVTTPQKYGSLWRELGRCIVILGFMALMLYALGLFVREGKKPKPLSNAEADFT